MIYLSSSLVQVPKMPRNHQNNCNSYYIILEPSFVLFYFVYFCLINTLLLNPKWEKTKEFSQIPFLSKVHKIEEGKFEMGISPVQLIRDAHCAKRWIETLSSLQTKENFTLVKYSTKYKISLHKVLILQWESTSAL